MGAAAALVRDPAHPPALRRAPSRGRRGRRRLPGLCQRPVRPARAVLHRPAVERPHRLGRRTGPALRPGHADARCRRGEPLRRPGRGRHARRGPLPRGGTHGAPHPRRGVLRPGRCPGAERHRARPVLRRRRPGPHGLHRMRQLHGGLPGRGEEHPGEELPGAGRAARGADRAAAHRRRPASRRPGRSGARLAGDQSSHRRLVGRAAPHRHRRARGARGRGLGHPEPVAPAQGRRGAARAVRPAR